jgi:hypothetical protein
MAMGFGGLISRGKHLKAAALATHFKAHLGLGRYEHAPGGNLKKRP